MYKPDYNSSVQRPSITPDCNIEDGLSKFLDNLIKNQVPESIVLGDPGSGKTSQILEYLKKLKDIGEIIVTFPTNSVVGIIGEKYPDFNLYNKHVESRKVPGAKVSIRNNESAISGILFAIDCMIDPDKLVLVVIDEIHLKKTNNYMLVIIKLCKEYKIPLLYITATPTEDLTKDIPSYTIQNPLNSEYKLNISNKEVSGIIIQNREFIFPSCTRVKNPNFVEIEEGQTLIVFPSINAIKKFTDDLDASGLRIPYSTLTSENPRLKEDSGLILSTNICTTSITFKDLGTLITHTSRANSKMWNPCISPLNYFTSISQEDLNQIKGRGARTRNTNFYIVKPEIRTFPKHSLSYADNFDFICYMINIIRSKKTKTTLKSCVKFLLSILAQTMSRLDMETLFNLSDSTISCISSILYEEYKLEDHDNVYNLLKSVIEKTNILDSLEFNNEESNLQDLDIEILRYIFAEKFVENFVHTDKRASLMSRFFVSLLNIPFKYHSRIFQSPFSDKSNSFRWNLDDQEKIFLLFQIAKYADTNNNNNSCTLLYIKSGSSDKKENSQEDYNVVFAIMCKNEPSYGAKIALHELDCINPSIIVTIPSTRNNK